MEADWLLTQVFVENHPNDAALILEGLPSEEAATLLEKIPPRSAAAVIHGMAPMSAAECIVSIAPEQSGPIVGELPLDTAAAMLRRIDTVSRDRLLAHVPDHISALLGRLLQYPDGTAGALMDPRAVAFSSDISVGDALRRIQRDPQHVLYYLYVTDRSQHLIGVLNLRELMFASPQAPLASVMHTHIARLLAHTDPKTIVVHPGWRDYHALPVVDDEGVFVGVMRYETLRRLESEAGEGRPTNLAVSTMLNLGELCLIGLGGMLSGIAMSIVPSAKIEDKEIR